MNRGGDLERRNRKMMGKLLVVVVGMLGFAFAMVPMYRQICEAIGITQTRSVAADTNTQVDMSRDVTVELIASTIGLQWKFEALDRVVKMHPGELRTVRYLVVNTLDRPVTAHAVMSTAPAVAGKWIEKQACFCFTSQTLAAGESREMPVVFRVKAGVPPELSTISLSYTFYEDAARS
jgi:cytochrome c oxidase assembly protein subunit 11